MRAAAAVLFVLALAVQPVFSMGVTAGLRAKYEAVEKRKAHEEREVIESLDILENYDVLLSMEMLEGIEKSLDDRDEKGEK